MSLNTTTREAPLVWIWPVSSLLPRIVHCYTSISLFLSYITSTAPRIVCHSHHLSPSPLSLPFISYTHTHFYTMATSAPPVMSTEQFVLSFGRFVSRCGCPERIWSKNTPQFKQSNKALQYAWMDVVVDVDVLSYVANKDIKWKFVAEYAPWIGGVYEHLIGLVKRCLRKSLGGRHLESYFTGQS